MKNFKPNKWGINGPLLITRVLINQVCKTSVAKMTPEKCRGLMVYPPKEFYPNNYDDWKQLNDVKYTKSVLEAAENSSIFHVWNAFHKGRTYAKSIPKTAYEIIFEKNCPNVYNTSGDYI